MTLHRPAGSIEDKLRDVLNQLSPDEILAATGKRAATFAKICNPSNDYGLDLPDAAALDAALVARGLSPVFAPALQEIAQATLARLRGAPTPAADIDRCLRSLAREVGELNGEVDKAMADDALDARDRRRIAREAQDVIDNARAIRDMVEPPHGGAGVVAHPSARGTAG
jgi:hypothetical protein